MDELTGGHTDRHTVGLQTDDIVHDARLRHGDSDAFNHEAIAARVAELCRNADTPLNIALFGAWGSGKSSFCQLIKDQLAVKSPDVTLVRYDAWKFGGEAMKRNFISHAANELGIKDGKYHGGLYEDTKRVQMDPKAVFRDGRWWKVGWLVALLAATMFGILFAVGFVTMIANDSNAGWWDEVVRLGPTLVKALVPAIVAALIALYLLEGTSFDVHRGAPSEDERFTELFRDLVKEATSSSILRRTCSRLVFFIDELDRCSKSDVVATLTNLRTFLEQHDCVFIVAADRDVLEAALDDLEQSTPTRVDEPYYSSASAFLDKIFQHQFALPPFRSNRLTGFARELVVDRGGVWGDLRNAEPHQRLLGTVLYVLIPSHVRSPRRVKVLLNNFATNARVAQARGIDWLSRAPEIAKLTVLQTEFPHLARDLHLEPRLPSFLIKPAGATTERQLQLLARHSLDEDEDEPDDQPTDAEAPDKLLDGNVDVATSAATASRQRQDLARRQRQDLARYLRSRHTVAHDPGHDLLYLEAAGERLGLSDPLLNQTIEEDSPTEPSRALEMLRGQPPSDRLAAAKLLGQLSEREFGPERRNMITVLAGCLERLEPDSLRGQLGELIDNVRSYRQEDQLTAEQLPGVLVLAIAAGAEGRDLVSDLLKRPELLDSPERIASVAQLLPVLDDFDAHAVEVAVAECFEEAPDILLSAIRTAPPHIVTRLIDTAGQALADLFAPEVVTGVAQPGGTAPAPAMQPDAMERAIGSVVEALAERGSGLVPAIARLVVTLLDGNADTGTAIRQIAPSLFEQLEDASLVNNLALAALARRPIEEDEFWSTRLVAQPDRDDERATAAINAIVDNLPTAGAAARTAAAGVLRRIVATCPIPFDDDAVALIAELEQQLAASSWPSAQTEVEAQLALYAVAKSLVDAGPGFAGEIDRILLGDLRRGDPAATPDRLATLAAAGPDSLVEGAQALLLSAEAAPLGDDARIAVTGARVHVAAELNARGIEADAIDLDSLLRMAAAGTRDTDAALSLVVEHGLAGDDVLELLAARGKPPPTVTAAVASWMETRSATQRAATYIEATGRLDEDWLKHLAMHEMDNAPVLRDLAEQMHRATASGARERILAAVLALRLSDSASKRIVADMAHDLLARDPNKAKGEVASKLVEHLNGEFPSRKGLLQDACRKAAEAGALNSSAIKRFERAGLLQKKQRGTLSRIFRNG